MGHMYFLDEMGLDEMGLDKMGINGMPDIK